MDLTMVAPVGPPVRCGTGFGLALCPSQGLVVTSCSTDSTLSAFDLTAGPAGAGPRFPLLGTWGGLGLRLSSDNGPCGLMCFAAVPGDGQGGARVAVRRGAAWAPTLLVADTGSHRVVEVDLRGVRGGFGPTVVGTLGVAAPRGLAACPDLIAVSAWDAADAGDHTVTLYHAVTRVALRRVGTGRSLGLRAEDMHGPTGVCFRAVPAPAPPLAPGVPTAVAAAPAHWHVLVADGFNHRVSEFDTDTGACVGTVASRRSHGLSSPAGVLFLSQPAGVVVTDCERHVLMSVSTAAGADPPHSTFGEEGHLPGRFRWATAVAACPAGALGAPIDAAAGGGGDGGGGGGGGDGIVMIVREALNHGRFQVLSLAAP